MNMHDVKWSAYAFEGKLVSVRIDTVDVPNIGLREREIVEHPGAVGIVPVLPDGRVVLIRQYRPATGRSMLEIPAGTLEPGETPVECAIRELAEETGYRTDRVRELVRFFVSPGWCTEELICYVAEDIEPGSSSPDDTEQIEVETTEPSYIPDLIRHGEIADSKTLVSLTAYYGIRLSPGEPLRR
jgi:8-oxo-dGTP pyrophosphatase MutT (NUDIX family)